MNSFQFRTLVSAFTFYWNVDISGFGGGLNAGIDGKGIPLITRYNKNGGLLKYIIAR